MIVESDDAIGNNHNITMGNIVRKVKAKTKETAIGKFVIATKDIKVKQKLNIECYDLTELKSIP